MPTSLETLLRYRAAHADCCESCRAWLFHSHTYFDHASPERVAEARAFMDLIERTFAATPHLQISSFIPAPAGPHPRGSFEVLFTREIFADYLSWLMFSRPEGLDILIHPLTRSQTLDHTKRALWLGTPVAIDIPMLEAVDAELLASGRTEESIIDGTKTHRRVGGRKAMWSQAKRKKRGGVIQPLGLTGAPGRI
jgi:aromatic ring-cleaving dioxygenase